MKNDLAYWIAFSKINGLGPVKLYSIWKYFQSLETAWNTPIAEFRNIQVLNEGMLEQIESVRKNTNPEKELELLAKRKVGVICMIDNDYPLKLKEVGDPPPVLYYRGNYNKELFDKCIGIVGTRTPSPYGVKVSGETGKSLSDLGITVVSGLAMGVDTYAHKGAMEGQSSRTIAVLGCGPDIIYPNSNARLYSEIIEKGLVISEYPQGSKPEAWRFPARNRIISGLSDAVLIIEAGERSGALITSDFAAEQGREVFALPGEITNPMSKGANNLIKQGAAIFTGIEDITSELNWKINKAEQNISLKDETHIERINLSEPEKKIYLALDDKPQHLDIILSKVEITPADLTSNLIMLELKQLIKQLPGNLFVRI